MDIKDIITLVDKGFSPEQIMQLAGMSPAAEQPPQVAEPVPAEPVEETQVTEHPSDAPSFEDVMKEIAALKSMMTKQNIALTEMASPQPKESVHDILASLING